MFAVMNATVKQAASNAKRRNYNKLASAPYLRHAAEYHNTLHSISL